MVNEQQQASAAAILYLDRCIHFMGFIKISIDFAHMSLGNGVMAAAW